MTKTEDLKKLIDFLTLNCPEELKGKDVPDLTYGVSPDGKEVVFFTPGGNYKTTPEVLKEGIVLGFFAEPEELGVMR